MICRDPRDLSRRRRIRPAPTERRYLNVFVQVVSLDPPNFIHLCCSNTAAKYNQQEQKDASDTSHRYAALCSNSCRREIKNDSSMFDFGPGIG